MLSGEKAAVLSASLPRPKSPQGYRPIAKGRPAAQQRRKAVSSTAAFFKRRRVTFSYSFAKIAQVERINGLYTQKRMPCQKVEENANR